MKNKINLQYLSMLVLFLFTNSVIAEGAWYAQINRGLLRVDDGYAKKTFFVDSAYDNSLIGIKGEVKINDLCNHDLKAGGQLELGIMPNNSNDYTADAVSQLSQHGKRENIKLGIFDTWIFGEKLGKFSVGRGGMASKGTGNITLSEADLISYAGASDLAGGMYFHPQGAERNVLSTDPQIGGDDGTFDAISGAGTMDRVRYDTPKFNGFTFSTSIGKYTSAPSHKYCIDFAVRYEELIGKFQVNGAVAIALHSKDYYVKNKQVYDSSLAILHQNTGLNAAVSIGEQRNAIENVPQIISTEKHRKFYYVQLGKQTTLIEYGKTNFALDYWGTNNCVQDYDKARAYGAGVVQKFDNINTDLYLGFRNYQYKKLGQNYDRILAILLGVRIKFNSGDGWN